MTLSWEILFFNPKLVQFKFEFLQLFMKIFILCWKYFNFSLNNYLLCLHKLLIEKRFTVKNCQFIIIKLHTLC